MVTRARSNSSDKAATVDGHRFAFILHPLTVDYLSNHPPETLEGYQKPLQVENWDKALWELTLASNESKLTERLSEFNQPVLVITGDDNRIVPTE